MIVERRSLASLVSEQGKEQSFSVLHTNFPSLLDKFQMLGQMLLIFHGYYLIRNKYLSCYQDLLYSLTMSPTYTKGKRIKTRKKRKKKPRSIFWFPSISNIHLLLLSVRWSLHYHADIAFLMFFLMWFLRTEYCLWLCQTPANFNPFLLVYRSELPFS